MGGFDIQRAIESDAPEIAALTGELLLEITRAIGAEAVRFSVAETALRLGDFLARDKYFAFLARSATGDAAGFAGLYEYHAERGDGAAGTLSELYVRPEYRAMGLGARLVSEAKSFGAARGWKSLDVTTPPVPEFADTLAFYEREGFVPSGSRRLTARL